MVSEGLRSPAIETANAENMTWTCPIACGAATVMVNVWLFPRCAPWT